jgi:hypothetical protein
MVEPRWSPLVGPRSRCRSRCLRWLLLGDEGLLLRTRLGNRRQWRTCVGPHVDGARPRVVNRWPGTSRRRSGLGTKLLLLPTDGALLLLLPTAAVVAATLAATAVVLGAVPVAGPSELELEGCGGCCTSLVVAARATAGEGCWFARVSSYRVRSSRASRKEGKGRA